MTIEEITILIVVFIISIPLGIWMQKISEDVSGITDYMRSTELYEKAMRSSKHPKIQELVSLIDENRMLLKWQKRRCFVNLYETWKPVLQEEK